MNRMIAIDKGELEHMRKLGITLCSVCRNRNPENKNICLARLSVRCYEKGGYCPSYIPESRTPEQQRIEARRAAERQGTLFDAWGHASGDKGFDREWRPGL